MKVSVSLLSADFGHLQEAVDAVPDTDWFHIDVMDGHFVPNITFGPVVMNSFKTKKPLDVHLMVNEPEKFIDWFEKAQYITFHAEAAADPAALIKKIRSKKIHTGITLKPGTAVDDIVPFLKDVDLVLVMSVEPGFAGQKFLSSALEKISFLKTYRDEHGLKFLISVDGGINEAHALQVRDAGVDVIVAATYVYGNKEPNAIVQLLHNP
ncbi:MAG: ribulose-phosphate 3-epimerase [Nanoarchaeota archaeon]